MVNKAPVSRKSKAIESKPIETKRVKKSKTTVEDTLPLTEASETITNGGTSKELPPDNTLEPERPSNTAMPEDYSLLDEPKNLDSEGKVAKLCTYNVASLKAASQKGLLEYVKAENPEILCLQETKLQKAPEEDQYFSKSQFPFQAWWCSTAKKGYSGTAILSKFTPVSQFFGFKNAPELDSEGRVITVEFSDFYLVNAYVPNAGDKLVRLEYRLNWDKTMKDHLISLESTGKPVIYTGDLNVAHHPIDLANPKQNLKTAGFTQEERDSFSDQLKGDNSGKYSRIDVDRHFHPEEPKRYTFYSYRSGARSKGTGWRLDYFVVSESMLNRMVASDIRFSCYGASDHVPSVLWFKTEATVAALEDTPKKDLTFFFKSKK